jgi:hypothetical protein
MKKNISFLTIVLVAFCSAALVCLPSCAFAQAFNFQFLSGGQEQLDFGSFEKGTTRAQAQANLNVLTSSDPYIVKASYDNNFLGSGGQRLQAENLFLEVRGVFKGTTIFRSSSPLAPVEREIYTSDDTGSSEMLTLDFSLEIPAFPIAGEYTSRLTLYFYKDTGGIEELIEQKQYDITFSVEPYIEMTLTTPRSTVNINQIDFRNLTMPMERGTAEVVLTVNTNLGKKYRVEQTIETPFTNDRNGESLKEPVFLSHKLYSETSKGELYSTYEVPLTYQKENLYISNAVGENDSFQISYYLTNAPELTYGRYFSYMTFSVVPYDNTIIFDPQQIRVRVSFEIEKILSLKAVPVDQTSRIAFGSLKKGSDEVRKAVRLEVTSNVGEGYLVKQRFIQPVINTEGTEFRMDQLSFMTDSAKKGTTAVSGFQPLNMDEVVLYKSDNSGISDSFQVIYALKWSNNIIGGNYMSGIKYTVEEIK